MSTEGTGNVGNGQGAVGGQPAASSSPAPQANPSGGVAQGGVGAGSQGSSTDFTKTKHKVKVNGAEMEVGYEDLVNNYQLREASNKRFEEAARKEKEAELYRNAVLELNEIIEKKDYSRFKEVVGDDFIGGLSSGFSGEGNRAQSTNYSADDKRLADALGVPVEEFVAKKQQAFGLDNPQIPEIQKQINTLMEENKQLKQGMMGFMKKAEVDKLENAFMSVADKYPEVDKLRALDIIERERRTPQDFELVFKSLQEQEDQRLEERYNKRMQEKKKMAAGIVGGINTMETPEFSEDEFKGKSFNERMALLINKSKK